MAPRTETLDRHVARRARRGGGAVKPSAARRAAVAAVAVAVATLVLVTPAQAGTPRDTDHDGMPDRLERAHGLDWRHANARADADHDGIPNLKEFRLGSDPRHADANTACSTLSSALGGDPSVDCTSLTEVLL